MAKNEKEKNKRIQSQKKSVSMKKNNSEFKESNFKWWSFKTYPLGLQFALAVILLLLLICVLMGYMNGTLFPYG